MEFVIFNASLYVASLLIYWLKRRKTDAGLILLAVYSAIAIACVFNYASNPHVWKLQLWSFIYLFIIVILFFRPYFFDSNTLYQKLYVRNKQILKFVTFLYILLAYIAIFYSINQAIENIKLGAWLFIRNQLYANEIELYTNQLDRVSKIISGYLRPVAIILFFYYLTNKELKKIWLIIFGLSIIGPLTITAINTASRGLLVNLAVSLFIGYMIFRKGIPKSTKKVLVIVSLILIFLALSFSMAVIDSRFGESQRGSSLLSYFGQSMLNFNYGLTDSIRKFGNGKYFLDWFLPLFGIDQINMNSLGTHFGTGFFTFVGAWYIDFGPVGTFLIALLLPLIISRIFRYKSKVDIADLYIYMFYLEYLIMGVFVIGRGYALSWFIAIIIYTILKVIR